MSERTQLALGFAAAAPVLDDPGKVSAPAAVASDMADVIRAMERALRKGGVETPPAVDAERLYAVAYSHALSPAVLDEAIEAIRGSGRVEHPLGRVVFRVLGDSGADVLSVVRSRLG